MNVIDTNILVYAYDLSEPIKRKHSLSIVKKVFERKEQCAVALQSLGEFFTVVTKKISKPFPVNEAQSIVNDFIHFSGWHVIDATQKTLQNAMEKTKHGQSFWDAMIESVALENGFTTIITEDEKGFPGMKVINPFGK